MKFAGRLILGMLLVVLVVVGTLVAASEYSLRRDLESDIRQALERDARVIAGALPADSLAWQAAAHDFGERSGLRVTLIDRTGRVRGESDLPAEALNSIENHLYRPEVQQALKEGVGSDRRMSATIGHPLMYVALPGGPGIVRVASPLTQVDAIVHRSQRSVLVAALAAVLLGVLLATIAGRSVAKPLTSITRAARAIAAGAQPQFPHSGIPDVDALVHALREMHNQLGERFEELRRGRAESAALIESMIEGVIAADARGHILTANTAARRLLGYDPEESLPELTQIFRAKGAREVVDAALTGSAVLGRELELDDQVMLLSARPLPQGGAVLVLHDITAIRRLETVRRDFVANVSHELKTPLTSISGYTETLLTDHPDETTSRRFLEVIHANARRMQRLVDGLLDLSRIESGSWQPAREPVDLGAVARESWNLLATDVGARGIAFACEIAPGAELVVADPDALRQVLTNLLENAIRYSPQGGRIRVSARPEGSGIAVAVADTGVGITTDHLSRIFERFYRADPARARDQGGTGLGLAIVKHLVEAHGGHVSAESEVGAGTTITCWFPLE